VVSPQLSLSRREPMAHPLPLVRHSTRGETEKYHAPKLICARAGAKTLSAVPCVCVETHKSHEAILCYAQHPTRRLSCRHEIRFTFHSYAPAAGAQLLQSVRRTFCYTARAQAFPTPAPTPSLLYCALPQQRSKSSQ